MITSYILVLALSAWLVTSLLLYVAKRFGKLFGNPALISPGFVILLPLLGFLVVVAAPSAVSVGAVLLLGAHLTRRDGYLPPMARFGVPLIAALLTGSMLVMPAIPSVPPLAVTALSILVLFGFAVTAEWFAATTTPASIGLLAASIPLLAAPFMGGPAYIAIDILLLASVLLAANISAKSNSSFALARQPIGLILGWLVVTSATHGAWIPAVVATLAYGAAIAAHRAHPTTELQPHVS